MSKPKYLLFDRSTTAIVFGMQTAAIQRMLDFDHLCRRPTPSVVAIVNPTGEPGFHRPFFGSREVMIPIYTTLAEAAAATDSRTLPSRCAGPCSLLAVAPPTGAEKLQFR